MREENKNVVKDGSGTSSLGDSGRIMLLFREVWSLEREGKASNWSILRFD